MYDEYKLLLLYSYFLIYLSNNLYVLFNNIITCFNHFVVLCCIITRKLDKLKSYSKVRVVHGTLIYFYTNRMFVKGCYLEQLLKHTYIY